MTNIILLKKSRNVKNMMKILTREFLAEGLKEEVD